MKLRLIVPAKAFSRGKSRLAPVLDAAARRGLSRRFLDQTLRTALQILPPADIVAISDGADAREHACALGITVLAQSGRGLNQALDQARDAARAEHVQVLLVLPSDLPFLSPDDITAVIDAGEGAGTEGGPFVIARDRSCRGTNALLLPVASDFRFSFGPDSAVAHIAEAQRCGHSPCIMDRPGIAFDVDTPSDYSAYAAA